MVICYSTKNIKKPFEIAGSNLKGVILLIILWISPLLLKGQNCQKLFQSVAENDTESVRILLLKNTNINCKNEIGQSPLALAVIKDNVDMVQLLLDQKANINLPVTTTLETPLILAAKAHNQQLVRLLLENGADPNIADSAGRTPLIWCCIRNDYELIKYLLGNGADLHKTTNYGNTALELAIWYQNTISAKILMIRGANLNSQGSKDKGTPLLYACIKEEYALAIELIRRGANVHAVNKNGDGILHILAKDSQSLEKTEFKYSSFSYIYPTIQDTLYTEGIHSFYEYLQSLNVDLFLRNNEGFMPLHIAAINNNKALIYALTKDKSNLNNRENKLGATPLVCALRNNHPRSAKILLYEKPDVQIMDTNGWTPLHYASRDNYQEIVLTLLEMDAQVNVVNRNNWTPMHLAAYNGNDCIVRLLLHFGADKSLKNSLGETAEMLAANKNLDETIQILKLNKVGLVDLYLCGMSNYVQKQVANGLNLNEVDSKGRNLLHAALLNGNSGFAENLIQSGIDFKIKDSSGTSPFLLAARENLQEICLLLLDKGAAVNDYDTSGMSALHYAVKNDDTLLVRLLLIKGANVNKRHRTEGTPLEVACWYHGNTSSIECLTSYGAEINPEHFTTWSPLSLAIKKEFREAALWLVKHGANVNFKMGNGVTILHMIVGQQMGSLFMECINRGADINAQTTDSLITSLHLAAECNNLNMVKILFWNGADTNLRMLGNLRPVDIAIGKGNLEIARFLQSPV
jgi:serine/threonine-protein phosphatase 6 regulatory ankyrin repeat subunit B